VSRFVFGSMYVSYLIKRYKSFY